MPLDITEQIWRLVDALPLPASFYGQIVIKIQQGRVDEVEVTQKHRRPPLDAKPPERKAKAAGRSEAPKAA